MKCLKQGDRGREVFELQALLNMTYGMNLKVDGVFGPLTAEGVERMTKEGNPIYTLAHHLNMMLWLDIDKLPLRLHKLYNDRTPYIWGGKMTGPGWKFNNSYDGLDCSGLVTALWPNKFDPLMDNAARIYQKVEHINSPEPMDLAFYGPQDRPHHVVIVVDHRGGIVGMQRGGKGILKPNGRAGIQYYPSFAYRSDFIGFGRVK